MRPTDFFFTPRDLVKLIRFLIVNKRVFDMLGALLVIAGYIVLQTMFHVSLESTFFLLVAFIVFYWRLDGRFSIGAALACFVIIFFLQLMYNLHKFFLGDVWSETVAVWAYYFLVIGVAKQIVEFVLENRKKTAEQNAPQ